MWMEEDEEDYSKFCISCGHVFEEGEERQRTPERSYVCKDDDWYCWRVWQEYYDVE